MKEIKFDTKQLCIENTTEEANKSRTVPQLPYYLNENEKIPPKQNMFSKCFASLRNDV